MNIKNNKGFSLIEVLVTVGLIGILVGIAVPSYQGYKQNTVKMALKADLGSGSKVYNARYAVDSTYCFNLTKVGLSAERSGNPIYKKKAFYGFETASSDCGITHSDTTPLNFKTAAGYCAASTSDDTDVSKTKTACDTDGTNKWTTSGADREFNGSTSGCILDSNTFKMGATTDVSGLSSVFFTADQEGKISEGAATANCQ